MVIIDNRNLFEEIYLYKKSKEPLRQAKHKIVTQSFLEEIFQQKEFNI